MSFEEYCRIHHHMIVNREALYAVEKCWKHGKMRKEQLRDQADYTPWARYMLAQTPCRPGRKNVGRSMNLQKPFERIEVMKNPNEPLTPPKGAKVLHKSRNKIVFTYKNGEIEDEDRWLKWMGKI